MSIIKRTKAMNGRKVVVFEAEVYVRGVRVAYACFDTQAAAHVWHDETKQRIEAGRDDPGSVMTFGEVVDEYRKSAFKELRKSSQQARGSRFCYLTEAPIAKVLMRDFGPQTVDEWLRWLKGQATSACIKRKSFEQELKLISVILNWYKNDRDYRFISPIVRGHRKRAMFKPVPVRPQDYYMRPAEVIAWLEHLKLRPDPVYYRLALLMVLTGLRMGEAAGLCWDAVELDDGGKEPRLRVLRTLSWDYRTKEAYFQDEVKTDSSVRTVPIQGPVVEMFREMKVESKLVIGAVPVFINARGRLLRDNTIRDNFNAAFAACKLSWSGTHIARHTFATLALISERDLGAVQAALGHASQKITQGYAKVVALQSSRVSGNVARLIGIGGSDVARH